MAAVVRRAKDFYNTNYERRPMGTLCVTNALLGIVSDITAQTMTYVNYQRSHRIPPEQRSLNERLPERLHDSSDPPPHFDPWRTLRFATYGFLIAPPVGRWFAFLEKRFPLRPGSGGSATLATVKRVAVDQTVWAPFGIALFFTIMGTLEGHGIQGVQEKFRDAYWPAFKANYTVWPAVQFVNFRYLPLQFRLPFVSTCGIAWNAYLSWLNAASKNIEDKQVAARKEETKYRGMVGSDV
ncbi:hypothetical protein BZG36_00067 [Bifiguratus adelaidae]|uniref:Protein SYM1 n=1 Tax=Bifiguratus adelaidae TaxID=1938954 RepID=A0A261Y8N4_9FUNG|nr:hypothetical protein BZG36_00067 [Bifiguratus adelaidae]